MSEELVIRQCAPTLAGIKTGNLFCTTFESREALLADVRSLNQRLRHKGLCLLPLRCRGNQVLLYLYRPAKLRCDLKNDLALRMLSQAGYGCESAERCVVTLIRRLRERAEFPHEIGLFLSYPPEDVRGFIENKARNFKCAGLWKVYGDPQKAKALFAKYKKCTKIYCKLWQAGSGMDQLAIAI